MNTKCNLNQSDPDLLARSRARRLAVIEAFTLADAVIAGVLARSDNVLVLRRQPVIVLLLESGYR
ncbi:hypothetical protein [Novipirellula aureliae]|uniref:hypothetical protein n=1 Tax=Novipirellula aureliae TaxID=2527966 RepID=UPI001E59A3F9|nr:hypothetical protein [Novipirellula aureliae]